MRSIPRWLGCVVVLTALGCGRQETSVSVPVKPPAEQARAMLEQFAQSGETDSSIVALREMLDAIAAKDPAKAGLLADCDALMSLRGKDQVKAKAAEMIGKLQ
jgi:hypothetical protein